MLRIHKIIDEEGLILKEEKLIPVIEVGTEKEIKSLRERESREKDTRVKKRKNAKQIIKEELKQAEFVEYDVIPVLRFTEIQANLDTVIEGYLEVGENLTYEKTREIATDLTRIENAIDNIATTISNEFESNFIYKKI